MKETYKLRRDGFPPVSTDAEVITMEICGSYFKRHQDKDLYGYFRTHYRHFFPNLSDCPSFVRQAANLSQVTREICWRILVADSGPTSDSIHVRRQTLT